MTETAQFTVPGIDCGHCETAVAAQVGRVPGVESVIVDLMAKRVRVSGSSLDDEAIRAAIREAGYDVA